MTAGTDRPARASAGRHGFSLVEILMVSAIAGLLLGPLVWVANAAFRSHRMLEAEVELTSEGIRLMRRMTRDVVASRGLVRFETTAGAGELDGLRMKDNRILRFERRPDGTLWRETYRADDYHLNEEEQIGAAVTYFHMVLLERGVSIVLELERALIGEGGDRGVRRDFATGVVPRGW